MALSLERGVFILQCFWAMSRRNMRWYTKIFAAALAAGLQACVTAPANAPQTPASVADARAPVTILISIDGFRADYLDRGVTPALSRLAAAGVTAPMRPAFPSKTFPNHWTLVTGESPDHSGIVANKMENPDKPDDIFTMASDAPYWWNEARPIWVDAERAGIRTATMFWPGSNVAWGGKQAAEWPHRIEGGERPSDWMQFNQAVSATQRVNGILDWLRRPAAIRPKFLTLYFDTVDSAGHEYGPDAPETTAAVADVDRHIGALVAGLAALDQPANLVIVADHGMAQTSSARTVVLGSLAAPEDYHVVETGPFASLAAVPGHEKALEARLLGPHDHVQCWRKGDIPARFHYGANLRIPPYFCLAETGWQIVEKAPTKAGIGGTHGYDNQAPEMAALFIASGPAFRAGRRLPAFDNVDIYPLLRDLIGLGAADHAIDGTDAPFRAAMAAGSKL